eukprot:1160082-Pelagomonas_calceolata.AAC.2
MLQWHSVQHVEGVNVIKGFLSVVLSMQCLAKTRHCNAAVKMRSRWVLPCCSGAQFNVKGAGFLMVGLQKGPRPIAWCPGRSGTSEAPQGAAIAVMLPA